MSLQTNLADVLERVRTQEATEQTRRIEETSKMVDDLVRQGIVEGPAYRLAPTTAMPHRISEPYKWKF